MFSERRPGALSSLFEVKFVILVFMVNECSTFQFQLFAVCLEKHNVVADFQMLHIFRTTPISVRA